MGLLSHLTATSLDEDYALASERRARAGAGSGARPGRWALVALISLAFVGRALAADAVLESSALRLEVSAFLGMTNMLHLHDPSLYSASRCSLRRNASNGNSGRPRMVK